MCVEGFVVNVVTRYWDLRSITRVTCFIPNKKHHKIKFSWFYTLLFYVYYVTFSHFR